VLWDRSRRSPGLVLLFSPADWERPGLWLPPYKLVPCWLNASDPRWLVRGLARSPAVWVAACPVTTSLGCKRAAQRMACVFVMVRAVELRGRDVGRHRQTRVGGLCMYRHRCSSVAPSDVQGFPGKGFTVRRRERHHAGRIRGEVRPCEVLEPGTVIVDVEGRRVAVR